MPIRRSALALALAALMVAAPASAQTPAAPPAAAASTVQLPQPVRLTLSNGLTLLVIERHNLPIISINAVVRAGETADPAGKAGLAALTAELLTRGAGGRTAPQIAEAIDFVGGSLSATANADSTHVSLSVLKKDLDLGLGLFADALSRPAFPEPELKRAKEETSAALRSALDDANEVVKMAFEQTLLKGNPYGTPTTLSSLGKLGRADVQGFYERFYRPNNTFMAVVGDISPAEARARVEAALGGWKARAVPAIAVPAPQAGTGKQVVLVDMPVNQSFIRLGNVAVKRNNPDYFPLTVLNFILGGDFTSRFMQHIRDQQGLAYGANSRFDMELAGGTFAAYLNTKSETTPQAIRSMLKEIRTIQTESVSDAELGFAKDYLTGSFPLRFETNGDLASEVVNEEFFGLPADYLATWRARVRAVTAADLQRVARQYLRPDQYTLVVVAKATGENGVAQGLSEFGPVTRLEKPALIR